MEMKIHSGLILFLISLSLFASTEVEGKFKGKNKISMEVETLEVQVKIVSLLEQIKEQLMKQNSQVIKEISNGLKEVTKHVKENTKVISNGLKENTEEIKEITKQVRENSEFLRDFTSEIKDNTNGIKEISDENKKINNNINDIINKIGKINDKEIKANTNGTKENVGVVTNSTEYHEEIKESFAPPKNCDDLRLKGDKNSGIQTVYPYPNSTEKSIKVLCDQQTEDGGWTIFQARNNLPERENFNRNWNNYSHGFGDLNGEFWMGLELLNVMTKLDVMELRVDLEDDTGDQGFAKYETFSVEDEDEKFKLNIGAYGGTAGDSLSYHNQRPFSTNDVDNDGWPSNSCAIQRRGAWWYYRCHESNLNGYQHVGNFSSSHDDGIEWYHFRGSQNSMAKTKMMFRPSARINN